MEIYVKIRMKNGDEFKTKKTFVTEEELEQTKNLFNQLGKLTTLNMECESGHVSFNVAHVSSIQIVECVL